jgi:GT2 family glycosyltransferase
MSVLVGIVSKNRCEILPKAIESALHQDYPKIEVQVVDDNSTDDTRSLVSRFPGVHWNLLQTSQGYVSARNKMMSSSEASYFCSLDDDSWFIRNDTLKLAVEFLETNLEVAAVAFDIISPDNSKIRERSEPRVTNNFIGCGHVLRLKAVREVGFYDPNPSFYGGEEKDLCIKLLDRNYKIVLMPGLHVWHDKTLVSRDLSAQHTSGVCNDLVFLFRRAPSLYLFPGLIVKIFKHIKFAVQFQHGVLFKAGALGIFRFLSLAFTFQLKRAPVSMKTFHLYNKLNK